MPDDKLNFDEEHISDRVEDGATNADLDGVTARQSENAKPRDENGSSHIKENNDNSGESTDAQSSSGGIGELVAISVKAIAVVLSLVIMLTCILAVGLPLQSMRIFNSLGMSERAIDFGERYISRELRGHDAQTTDERGNYTVLSTTSELTNDDFIEALYVTVNLSSKLMESYYGSGDDRSGAYYAQRVEKYTRMYMSLNNISAVVKAQSEHDVLSVPMLAMRPLVYDYAHSMRALNFRARAYLGETGNMLYDSGRMGDSVSELIRRSNTYSGLILTDLTDEAIISTLDGFVDYVGQLGEYLDVEFLRAGVENDLSKRTPNGGSILSESYVPQHYGNYLDGDEFSLFVTRADGFTDVYNGLKRFAEYAQLAVNFNPSDRNDNKVDEQLHQLYWLQELYSTQQRLWYMAMLLNYSSEKFGAASQQIRDEYSMGTCRDFMFVTYPGTNNILGVYQIKFTEYISQYQS